MVFKKFDVTKFAGINSSFDIYINDTKQIIYKKVKRKKVKRHSRFNLCKKDFHEYKNIILDIQNTFLSEKFYNDCIWLVNKKIKHLHQKTILSEKQNQFLNEKFCDGCMAHDFSEKFCDCMVG